jgi:hypothetical protein
LHFAYHYQMKETGARMRASVEGVSSFSCHSTLRDRDRQ